MKKLLLASDILIEAAQNEASASFRLIEECRNTESFQVWIMSDAIRHLVELSIDPGKIQEFLAGFSQIPINAYLNQKALDASGDFQQGLYLSAAKVFRIDAIVTNEEFAKSGESLILSVEQALNLNEDGFDKVDFMNLNLGLHPILDQVDGWFMEIIQDTAFAGGAHVDAFEREFADFCGIPHSIGVGNGTDALLLSLLAMGIGPGDEIITVPNTFIATTEAITYCGAKAVFVDVLPDSYCMDPSLIESKITERTKAIMPVHLYGQIADMASISAIAKKYSLKVLEDACQAHGAERNGQKAGTFGNAAAFSMYPGKNIGAFGEAGCVVTNDDQLADMIRCLKDHGQSSKYYHKAEGLNCRMDNLQAAVLRAKLPLLNAWNEKRRKLAKLYIEKLKFLNDVQLPVISDYSDHVFHQFVILTPDPNALADYLRQKNISTAFHYPIPLHLQAAYQNRGEKKGSYPVAEYCSERLISLPIYPELSAGQVEWICEKILNYYN